MIDNDELDFIEDDVNVIKNNAPKWLILVADDEKDIHLGTEFSLRGVKILDKEIELISVYSGKEAIELIESRDDIDLLLLDQIMESENAGIDAATYIRTKLNKKIPTIIMRSGYAGWEVEKGLKNNKIDCIDDFILKSSASRQVLLDTLEKWLPKVLEIKNSNIKIKP